MTATILSISLRRPLAAAIALTLGLGLVPQIAAGEPVHGIAMIGEPALPANFDHLPYANPDAPKGGKITYGVVGTFESLNPFIVQGGFTSARGLSDPAFGNLVFESLLERSADEAFTLYGNIAETVETPADRSWVEFTLNPNAKFSDGTPVTVDDVIFSMAILSDKGRPNYKAYYSKVSGVEKVGERGVRFDLNGAHDRELPLIIGLMPILPKHAIDPDTFDKSTLKPPIGSGPYIVSEVSAPNYIVYKRNPDYWGKDLPIHRGLFNYDEVRVEYYRDANTMFEAFKKGLYDVNPEGAPAQWNTAYNFPALNDGKVVKETFKTGLPKGLSGLVFNTRRPVFADQRVRQALATLFDFDWVNKNLYYGAFVRAVGYFNDSELSAVGRPASDKEKALLAPFPGVVADAVMNGTYQPVSAGGADGGRAVLADVVKQLGVAGYEIREPKQPLSPLWFAALAFVLALAGAVLGGARRVVLGIAGLVVGGLVFGGYQIWLKPPKEPFTGPTMVNTKTGRPLTFEIMVANNEDEKLALTYQRTLDRIGVKVSVRSVEDAQFQPRLQQFDYDMVRRSWAASLSPGNEQLGRWSSEAADRPSSFNYAGAKQPAIDAMIAAMLAAQSREDFVAAVRALDRVLISGYYVVPLFYLPDQWVARWATVEHPEKTSLTGYSLPTWWRKPGS